MASQFLGSYDVNSRPLNENLEAFLLLIYCIGQAEPVNTNT